MNDKYNYFNIDPNSILVYGSTLVFLFLIFLPIILAFKTKTYTFYACECVNGKPVLYTEQGNNNDLISFKFELKEISKHKNCGCVSSYIEGKRLTFLSSPKGNSLRMKKNTNALSKRIKQDFKNLQKQLSDNKSLSKIPTNLK